MPISVRLGLLTSAAFLVLLSVVGVLVHQRLGATLQDGIDQQLVDVATGLAAGQEDLRAIDVVSGSDGDPAVEREVAGVEPSDRDVQVLDREGRVVAASEDLRGAPPLLPGADLDATTSGEAVLRTVLEPDDRDGDELRVLARSVEGGVLLVAIELDSVEEAQAALLALYAPAAVVATALAGVLGYAIARRGLAPIDALTADAATIGSTDPRQRLTAPAREDEVGRLARTLNGMLDRLEAAVERERAFTADASHELRTPLAILRAEVELAVGRSGDADVEASLRSALEEADRLAGLIDDLLVLARAEAGGGERDSAVDLAAVVDALVDRFAALAATRGVRLDREVPGPVEVAGDARSVERALANLVDNAVRHTPAGGTVTVRAEPLAGGGARVVVSDTGPGLPEEELGRVFDRFARSGAGGASREPGGAGLGLAIVAAVAAAHGGSVDVANREGGGLRATLVLP